jgi:uncharacterized protein YlxW (UPF0749 family)
MSLDVETVAAGSAPDVRGRMARGLRRSGVAVAVVALGLGLLAVGQFRGQQGVQDLAGMSAPELTQLVANLSTRNEQLRDEALAVEAQARALEAASGQGAAGLAALRADLERIGLWSGTLAVEGPGVAISVRGGISAGAVEDILNELRNAGAEAMAIGGVRVVTGTVVAGPTGALSVENTPLGDVIDIRAVGSPEVLVGTLTRAGGIVAQLAATEPDARIAVTPLDLVRLPATTRDLMPSHARARL